MRLFQGWPRRSARGLGRLRDPRERGAVQRCQLPFGSWPGRKGACRAGGSLRMNARVLALLAILFALLLAGCSFRAEGENEDDDSEGGVTVGDGEDEDKDSPGPGLLMVLATFGLAGLARRKMMG